MMHLNQIDLSEDASDRASRIDLDASHERLLALEQVEAVWYATRHVSAPSYTLAGPRLGKPAQLHVLF
jgi:hypothetical protein